jgi:hypothetical protein
MNAINVPPAALAAAVATLGVVAPHVIVRDGAR